MSKPLFVTYEELKELKKCKRVLEIIAKKGIDIIEIKQCRKAKTYNENTKRTYCEEYTEEEFNLVKEYIENATK
jgi:tRNA isopentenyl-2-thiomethyl-A-37 hydroxylase MiaE